MQLSPEHERARQEAYRALAVLIALEIVSQRRGANDGNPPSAPETAAEPPTRRRRKPPS